MEQWIVHERDYEFTYAGLRQVIDKYLVQDRIPQYTKHSVYVYVNCSCIS